MLDCLNRCEPFWQPFWLLTLFALRLSEQLGLLGHKLQQYSELGPREYSKKVLVSALHGFAHHLQTPPHARLLVVLMPMYIVHWHVRMFLYRSGELMIECRHWY